MAVSENDLVVGPVVPAAGVTTISLDFYLEDAEWISVYKSGSDTPLVLGVDYSVSGEGTSSGVVTLKQSANGVDGYSVYLDVPLRRNSDLQLRGQFKSSPFNVELDRVWQAIQGLSTKVGQSLRVSRTSGSVAAMFAEDVAARAGRVVQFDITGERLLVGEGPGEASNSKLFASEAAATQAALEAIDAKNRSEQLLGMTDAVTDTLYKLGNVQAINFGEATNWQRVICPVTNPDTRYSVTVLADNTLQVDLQLAAVMFVGARLDAIARRGGRVYRVQVDFDAGGTALTSNTGVCLGFDPGTGLGANVTIDTAARGWTWRQNGTLTANDFNGSGGAVDATYAFTLASGAIPTYGAGDELMLELVESLDGTTGTLRGFKNGVQAFEGSVAAIPDGLLLAVFRGVGGGGAYPSAQRAVLSRLAASDPVQAPQITNINVSTGAPGMSFSYTGLGRAQALSPVRDANAFLARTPPTGFADWLPIRPVIVDAPGEVRTNRSLGDALFSAYSDLRSADVAYVEAGGDDSTGTVNDTRYPFLTIDAALQSSAKIVIVGDGTYAPPDYRFTQSAAGVMKLVVAKNPGRAIIKNAPFVLGDQTWTLVSGNVWRCQFTSLLGSGVWNNRAPHRVRLTDTLDEWGFKARLQEFPPATQDATGVNDAFTALNSAGTGWFWDGRSGNKQLYVALGGDNVEDNKERLEGLFYNASEADRIFAYGARLALQGFYIDGSVPLAFPYDDAGTEVPGHIWIMDSWIINSSSYGAQGDSGARVFIDGSRIHASKLDGINTDTQRSGDNQTAYGLLSGCVITASGDVDGGGTGISQNRQAVSSHAGYFAAFGCLFSRSWGQEVADTGTGAVNRSWYVGCASIDPDGRVSQNVGFGFYGDRQAWLDTCVASVGENPVRLESGASAKLFNTTLDGDAVAISPSVAPTAYTPDSP